MLEEKVAMYSDAQVPGQNFSKIRVWRLDAVAGGKSFLSCRGG
jgi:hypothetical protein